jgi:hypothetical protein
MLLTVTPYPYAKFLLASGLLVWEADTVRTMVAYDANLPTLDTDGGMEFQVTTAVSNTWDPMEVAAKSVRYNAVSHKTEVCAAALVVKPKASAISSGSASGLLYAIRSAYSGSIILPIAKLVLDTDGASGVVADTLYVTRPAGGVLFTI